MKAQELLTKYNIIPNNFYLENEHPYKDLEKRIQKLIHEYEGVGGYPSASYFLTPEFLSFKNKWQKYVEFYAPGILISDPCPAVFYNLLNDFFYYVQAMCPKFTIYRIHILKGVLRIQLNNITKEIEDEINILQDNLYDEKLIR